MQIRDMQEVDLEQVCAIEKQIFSQPWSRQDFLASIKNDTHIYLVAEQDGVVMGYCGMWGIVGEGQITNVAVAPQYRRQGVAKKLFRVFLDKGEQKGLTAFTLEVRTSNVPAIELYKSFGFKEAGVRKDFYELPKEDALIMWR